MIGDLATCRNRDQGTRPKSFVNNAADHCPPGQLNVPEECCQSQPKHSVIEQRVCTPGRQVNLIRESFKFQAPRATCLQPLRLEEAAAIERNRMRRAKAAMITPQAVGTFGMSKRM
jgi:hypothetical protein